MEKTLLSRMKLKMLAIANRASEIRVGWRGSHSARAGFISKFMCITYAQIFVEIVAKYNEFMKKSITFHRSFT